MGKAERGNHTAWQQTLEEGSAETPPVEDSPPLPATDEVSKCYSCMPALKQYPKWKHVSFTAEGIKTSTQLGRKKKTFDPDILQTVHGVKNKIWTKPRSNGTRPPKKFLGWRKQSHWYWNSKPTQERRDRWILFWARTYCLPCLCQSKEKRVTQNDIKPESSEWKCGIQEVQNGNATNGLKPNLKRLFLCVHWSSGRLLFSANRWRVEKIPQIVLETQTLLL